MENVAVIFGGKSVEHEVSIITGMQIMENMDKSMYRPIPIYITKDGKMLSGESLLDFKTFKSKDFSKAKEVFFKAVNNSHNLFTVELKKGGLFAKETLGIEKVCNIDVIFPALHGTYGEDGCVQGVFECMDIPYVGCGVMSAAVGMDKVVMKKVFQSFNIPMTEYFYFYRNEWNNQEEIIEKSEKIGYPLFVKPANLGSSVGISKTEDREGLVEAINIACHYDRKIIVEQAVVNPREINAAVLGYEDDILVSECEEPTGWKDFLSYEDKYLGDGKTKGTGMKNQKKKLPADIPESVKNEIQHYAKLAFRAIDGMGDARVDFLLDGEKVYVNEINTLPGSIAFYLWEASGISFEKLINKLIDLAKVRYRQKSENIYSIDSGLLDKTTFGAKL